MKLDLPRKKKEEVKVAVQGQKNLRLKLKNPNMMIETATRYDEVPVTEEIGENSAESNEVIEASVELKEATAVTEVEENEENEELEEASEALREALEVIVG